jgi:predicted dehydrogenase
MVGKIRLGLLGASASETWSSRAHFPALKASSGFELTAVCTTKPQRAKAARRANGARLALADYRAMVASPEIDAVAVVVRVPSHYAPTKATLEAGKHVYREWPLGRTTEEALELAALPKSTGRVTAVGLQARVKPALMYMRELVACCYVGEIRAVHVRLLRDRVLARPKHRAWQRDASPRANTLTIPNGHTVDAMRLVAGDFARRSAVVATQVRQWRVTDANEVFKVTSPDNVLVSGWLTNGAVVSSHVGTIPYAGSNYRMAIYGRDGTPVAGGEDYPQLRTVSFLASREATRWRFCRRLRVSISRRLAHRWVRPSTSGSCMPRSLEPSAAAAATIRRSRRRWPCIV